MEQEEKKSMNLTRVSIKLSYLLRHCQNPRYIQLDGGWASVKDILEVLRASYPQVNREVLDEIVRIDEKQRYSYDSTGMRIRANQGHSIPGVVIRMETPVPPEFLYHGTATKTVGIILREGLKPMKRDFVHISSDIETAVRVGKRHGNPAVLTIKARDFVEDGHVLYLSPNGVWLTSFVPREYICSQVLYG